MRQLFLHLLLETIQILLITLPINLSQNLVSYRHLYSQASVRIEDREASSNGSFKGQIPYDVGEEIVYPELKKVYAGKNGTKNETSTIVITVMTKDYGKLTFTAIKVYSDSHDSKIKQPPYNILNTSTIIDDANKHKTNHRNLMNVRQYLYEGNVTVNTTGGIKSYPATLIYKNGKLDSIFSMSEYQFEIYPTWIRTNSSITKNNQHVIVKYRLENATDPSEVDSFMPDISSFTATTQMTLKTQTSSDDILQKPYIIEGALFVDEQDITNITEETVILIGEKLSKIFDVLRPSINIRFKLVEWFIYPSDLVVVENMILNQRNLEKHLAVHPLRDTFDVGMLISSRAIESIKKGFIVGWANVGTMCRRNQSALVAWYKPTSVSYFLAHELTHLLNSYHDTEKDCEKGTQLSDQPFIDSKNHVQWSNCTIKIISDWIRMGKLDCLLVQNHKIHA